MNEITFSSPNSIKELTDADFAKAAQVLDVPEASIRAFAEVESAGAGFLDDGRPTILYEAHVFHKETNGKHTGARDPNGVLISAPKWDRSLYGKSGAHQYDRLNAAMALDPDAALRATSWGAFQVMGFNHEMVGYPTVRDMVADQVSGAAGQLNAFLGFIKARKLEADLRLLPDPDAAKRIARAYNGDGYAQNKYDTKIISAFKRHSKGAVEAGKFHAPLRLGSNGDGVHTLQLRLGIPADGVYGPVTQQAVRDFQKGARLMEDGIAGENTHGKLGLPWPPLA